MDCMSRSFLFQLQRSLLMIVTLSHVVGMISAGIMPAEVIYSYGGTNNQTLGLLGLAGLVIFLVWFAPRDKKVAFSRRPSNGNVPATDQDANAAKKEKKRTAEETARQRAIKKAEATARAKAEANAREEDAARELRNRPSETAADLVELSAESTEGSLAMYLNSRNYGGGDILDVWPPRSNRLPKVAWEYIKDNMAPKLKRTGDMSLESLVKEVKKPLQLFQLHYSNGYLDPSEGTLLNEPNNGQKNDLAFWSHQLELVHLAKGLFQWKLRTVVGADLGAGCLRLSLYSKSDRYDVTVFLPPKSKVASWDKDWEAAYAVLETVLAIEDHDRSKQFNLLIRPGADVSRVELGPRAVDGKLSKAFRWTHGGVADKVKDGAWSQSGLSGSFAEILTRIRPKKITVLAEPQHAYDRRAKRDYSLRADQLGEFIRGARLYRYSMSPVLSMLDCGPWLPRSSDGGFPLSDWTWVSNIVITLSGLSAEAKEDVLRLLWQEDDSLFSLLSAGQTNVCLCLETPEELALLKDGMRRYCAGHYQRAMGKDQSDISVKHAKSDIRNRVSAWNRSLSFAYRNDDATSLIPEEIDFKLGPLE